MSDVDAADDGDEDGRVLDEWIWTHDGLRCRVIKHRLGHYCGYVRSMFDERWSADDFRGYPRSIIDAPGGLNYGADEEGWVGFDCAHSRDVCVDEDGERWGMVRHDKPREGDTVWTLEDVNAETEALAEQVSTVQAFAETAAKRLSDLTYDDGGDP